MGVGWGGCPGIENHVLCGAKRLHSLEIKGQGELDFCNEGILHVINITHGRILMIK